jgi:hypothetical protein
MSSLLRPGLPAVSFAASLFADDGARAVIGSVLTGAVPRARRYVTRGLPGADAFTGEELLLRHPGAEHLVIAGAGLSPQDRWWLRYPAGRVTVCEMPAGSTRYDQNEKLAEAGAAMFGFPDWPETDPRSVTCATWQAIRAARRRGTLAAWYCVRPPYGCLTENESLTALR